MPAARTVATTLTGAVTLALTLGACAGTPAPATAPEPGATPSEAQSDGALVLYSGRDEELIGPLIELFEEKSGITAEVRYAGTTELAALILEEGEASPADVFLSQDAGALGAVAKAGLLAALPADVTQAVAPGFTSTDGTWTGVTGRARVIAYDGQELTADEVPDSVTELTDPEWKDRVGFPPTNASFQSFVTAFRVLEGEDAAKAWLAGIAANDPQRYEKNGAVLEAIDAGQLDLGLINHYYWYEKAAEVGADNMRVQLKFPAAGDPGALVNVSGAGVLTGGVEDGDALELVRFLVSPAAQQYFVENTFEYPLIEGVAAPAGLPDLESLRNPELDLSDLDSIQETVDLIAAAGLT